MVGHAIMELIDVNGSDTRRISHALKVLGFARAIAEAEGLSGDALAVVELAAVLHDIAIRCCEEKYGSASGRLQEKEGPAIALPILQRCGASDAVAQRVAYIIAHHHTYDAIDGLDYRIIVEADFLVNRDEGEFSQEAFLNFVRRYFVTKAGREMARRMFGAE
ncbi:MAG: HD domain-containing protein [Christensenellaceae bacterium]|nr:HD domain-containing protein [Christensenellaceae bacterium]